MSGDHEDEEFYTGPDNPIYLYIKEMINENGHNFQLTFGNKTQNVKEDMLNQGWRCFRLSGEESLL